jgi:hypothetical protein
MCPQNLKGCEKTKGVVLEEILHSCHYDIIACEGTKTSLLQVYVH